MKTTPREIVQPNLFHGVTNGQRKKNHQGGRKQREEGAVQGRSAGFCVARLNDTGRTSEARIESGLDRVILFKI